jgi:hypothetical protein
MPIKMTPDAIEKMDQLNVLTRQAVYGGAIVIGILFVLFFFSKKGGYKNKFIGLLAMLFGLACMLGCIYGGLKLGAMFGIGDIGALIGVGVFGVIFSIIGYFKTPKHLRRRSRF